MNASEAQRYARTVGVLVAISLVAGGFGESFAPGRLLVAGDAHATGLRVAGSLGIFRAGFAAYMVEAACDLSLTALFYLLMRPVSRPLALITAFLGLFGTTTFAVGEIFYYVAALPAMDAHFAAALSPEARESFAYVCLRIYGTVFDIFAGFYGLETMLRGYLFVRSGYLSKVLGGLLLLAGAGFVMKNLFFVLAPRYDSELLVLPMMVAMLGMAIWLPFKGIDRDRFQKMADSKAQTGVSLSSN